MTAVICWFDKSDRHCWPWAVADSRFSHFQDSQQILLDQGAKIYSFPLVIRKTWGFGEVTHFTNVGIAFAGSTLVAQNTMLCISSICGNLVYKRNAGEALSLEHVANLTARLAERFMRSLAVLREADAGAEFAIIGWCYATLRWRIFHLSPIVQDGLHIQVREFIAENEEDLLLLGDSKDRVKQEVRQVRAGYTPNTLRWWRGPVEAMSRLLVQREIDSIGGYLQMGIAVEATKSFNLSAIVQPIAYGQPESTFKFLGMDTREDIGPIGPCFIGMSGMVT